jgi:hypothetical protein
MGGDPTNLSADRSGVSNGIKFALLEIDSFSLTHLHDHRGLVPEESTNTQ